MATSRKHISRALRTAQPAPSALRRLAIVDAARAAALLMMFAYHFCVDLNYFGILHEKFDVDWRWLTARTIILSSFLLLVGVSLALHHAHGFSWARHWRRLGQIIFCAALVSVATYFTFSSRWIYFGVLHFIALASVLALPFLRRGTSNVLLGAALIAIGALAQHRFFDRAGMHWFGLMTYKPATEDYVPLLPWFGVVLIGIYLGRELHAGAARQALLAWKPRTIVGRILIWGGRHSLLLYMAHQPIFFALLYLVIGRSW